MEKKSSDGTNGYELWKSDGTASGTVLVKDINPGPDNSLVIQPFAAVGSNLFFAANDGTNGIELWVARLTWDGSDLEIQDTITYS